MATQRLTASDITSKIATGTPMGRNELLPSVPEGMSARGFYGQFPGGASVYGQAPFRRSGSSTPTIFDPTQEDTSTADTTPAETQMEEILSSSLDTSVRDEDNTSEGMKESSSLDNIATEIPKELFNWEEIKEDFNNFDTIEELEEVLNNGRKNIIAAANKGKDEFIAEINALGKKIDTITEEGPLNYLGRHVTDSIRSVVDIISDPFSKISVNTSLSFVGKSVGSNLLSALFSSLGFGLASTPLGIAAVAVLSGIDLEEGQKGRHFDNSTQETPNTIAGYNSSGVAVNSQGKPGMMDGMFAFRSIGDWIDNFGKSTSEVREDAEYNFASGDDSIEGGDPRGKGYSTNFDEINPGLYGVDAPVGFITSTSVVGKEPPIDFKSTDSKYFDTDKNPPSMPINMTTYTPQQPGTDQLYGPEKQARLDESWDYDNSGELSGWSAGSMDHTDTSGQATGHDDGYEDNSGDGDSGGGMDDGGGYGGVGGDDW